MSSAALPAYEKLGAFYLGRKVDAETQSIVDEDLLYDAKDLTTHALCVGMTGSGKTGLCVTLLEEALIDGVPVIAIDPKGDLSNLLLNFPELRPADFLPFVDADEALRKGLTREELAKQTARRYEEGLAEWNQDKARIARLSAAADFCLYTPGNETVRPLSVLRSLTPETKAGESRVALRERISGSVSSLLSLLGMQVDPLTSREHVLLTHIIEHATSKQEALDLARLIQTLQRPPFDRIGALDLETFFPAKERMQLVLQLNSLLASPSFSPWLSGEPLSIANLLRSPSGKPRLSVLSISHLSDSERMFFVSLLLGEVVAWMRTQSGSPSLRAILYMDEVFGFLPPVENPPSKAAMMTLLKQARAFGLGVVLATQNPVDVDYKALSNCGTWFLGRLQTERDKARVLDGLEGATQQAGQAFSRQACDRLLSGLSSRRFLMNNVHDDGPTLMHTRWALSYLRGPLTLDQLRTLQPGRSADATHAASGQQPGGASKQAGLSEPPPGPATLDVRFLRPAVAGPGLHYRPALCCEAQLHYVDKRRQIDVFHDITVVAELGAAAEHAIEWENSETLDVGHTHLDATPEVSATFAELPLAPLRDKALASAARDLEQHLYRNEPLRLYACAPLKLHSEAGESRAEFTARVAQQAREHRDLLAEKLRAKYAPKRERLLDRIRTAEERVEREESQVSQRSLDTAINVGTSLLGALFGGRTRAVTTAGRAARGAGRIAKERADVARVERALSELEQDLQDLEAEFEEEVASLSAVPHTEAYPVSEHEIRPRKGDIEVRPMKLLWRPYRGVEPDAPRSS